MSSNRILIIHVSWSALAAAGVLAETDRPTVRSAVRVRTAPTILS